MHLTHHPRSSSASISTGPPSPLTPGINHRLSSVAGKTMAGFRRISNTISPGLVKDSYFPPMSDSSIHSRQSSAGPTRPTITTKSSSGHTIPPGYFSPAASPAGLGVGLAAEMQTSWRAKSGFTDESIAASPIRSPQVKGEKKTCA